MSANVALAAVAGPLRRWHPHPSNPLLRRRVVRQQNLELFDAFQRQLAACDSAIETHLDTLVAQAPAPAASLPAPRTTWRPRDNEPRFELCTPLHQLTGVDLTQLSVIGPYTALRLLAEIGTDMRRWPTEKHFTSWLTLAPQNKISGGRLLSSRARPGPSIAAWPTGWARLKRSPRRPASSPSLSTARSNMVWSITIPGAAAYDALPPPARHSPPARQRATDLGLDLIDRATGELLEGAVS